MNQEFFEDLHQLELDDWNRHGKVCQKWEKYLRGAEPGAKEPSGQDKHAKQENPPKAGFSVDDAAEQRVKLCQKSAKNSKRILEAVFMDRANFKRQAQGPSVLLALVKARACLTDGGVTHIKS